MPLDTPITDGIKGKESGEQEKYAQYELQQAQQESLKKIAITDDPKDPIKQQVQRDLDAQQSPEHPLLGKAAAFAGDHIPETPLVPGNDEAEQRLENELRLQHENRKELQANAQHVASPTPRA